MITQKNIERLSGIVSLLALKDYKRANPKRKVNKNGTVKHNPYTLSEETEEARRLLINAKKENITREEEEEIKAYLLKDTLLLLSR